MPQSFPKRVPPPCRNISLEHAQYSHLVPMHPVRTFPPFILILPHADSLNILPFPWPTTRRKLDPDSYRTARTVPHPKPAYSAHSVSVPTSLGRRPLAEPMYQRTSVSPRGPRCALSIPMYISNSALMFPSRSAPFHFPNPPCSISGFPDRDPHNSHQHPRSPSSPLPSSPSDLWQSKQTIALHLECLRHFVSLRRTEHPHTSHVLPFPHLRYLLPRLACCASGPLAT
jgi:hypothetical protein